MRLGLLADIHGNRDALATTLEGARREGVERLLCAGDCVGYYYEPDECLKLLAGWDVECVRGNHEDMLVQLMEQPSLAEDIRRRYGSGLLEAARVLTLPQLAYLAGLPAQKTIAIQGKTVLLCHGAPWHTNEYVHPDAGDDTLRRCADYDVDYIVMGHTHYQMATQFGSTLLINPGSVGQPRDRRPGAAWALLDTDTGAYRHHTEPYNHAAVAARAREADPHLPYLWEVLTRE